MQESFNAITMNTTYRVRWTVVMLAILVFPLSKEIQNLYAHLYEMKPMQSTLNADQSEFEICFANLPSRL